MERGIVLVAGELSGGGAERQLLYLLRGLANSSLQVSVATLSPGGPGEAAIRALGIPIHPIPRGPLKVDRLLHLAALFRRERPLLAHSWISYSNLYVALAGALAGVPVRLGSVRNDFFEGMRPGQRTPLYRSLGLVLPHTVVVNSATAAAALGERGPRRARIRVARNGMDFAALREAAEEPWPDAALKSEGPVLALVGRLIPVKNVPMFLRTVRALVPRYPTIKGWVIGDGPLRTELASRAAEMGLTGHLRFWGEAANVPRLLARADLFCHCSWSEGLSNAIMEAAALGLPVVATRVGGAAELVEDEGSGFLVAPDDHVAMADRVSRLIDDPGLHARVGEAGRQKMESEFSLDRMVNDLLAVYGELLTREGLPAMQQFPC